MSTDDSDRPKICHEWKWFAIILAIIIVGLFLTIKPAGNRLSKTQKLQYQSELQLKSIGILLLSYKANFHVEPKQLSQIVPSDRIDLLPTFYAPNIAEGQRPLGWQTNRLIIDTYSDYVIPTKNNTAILVSEKPGTWKDGTVAICLTNLNVIRVCNADFQNLVQVSVPSPH